MDCKLEASLGCIVRSVLKKNLRGYGEFQMAQQIKVFIMQAWHLEFDLWNPCKGSLQSLKGFVVVVLDRISHSPGWPQTLHVAEDDLRITDMLAMPAFVWH